MANSKNQFYEVGSYTGVLREGSEICIQRQMTYRGQYADFKPFLNIPQKELEKRLNDSKAEEKKIYDGLQKAAKAWDEHGAQTLLLQKAIEYLKTPEVQHTANQWKQRKDGTSVLLCSYVTRPSNRDFPVAPDGDTEIVLVLTVHFDLRILGQPPVLFQHIIDHCANDETCAIGVI